MMLKLLFAGLALALQCLAADAQMLDPTPVAARYHETRLVERKASAADWYLVRRTGEVDIVRGDYAEVWKRDERGEIDLTRVFHDDRKLVAYSSGELRTQRRYPDWTTLNAVFDPRQVETMKSAGRLKWQGRNAMRYAGTLAGRRAEVVWLEQEGLAAKIVRYQPRGKTVLELTALRDMPDAAWPRVGLDGTGDYALIDGADFGDMESDPFVQRVMARDGMHGGEGGHAHRH